MDQYVGKLLAAEIAGQSTSSERRPFHYRDKGSMAIIGKSRAVAQIGRLKFGGFSAWIAWGVIHVVFLVGFRNRLQVLASWFWNWLLNTRDVRLITGPAQLEIEVPRSVGFVPLPQETQEDSSS